MKMIAKLVAGLACLALPARAAITGQWDFDNGNLTATVGPDLSFLDGAGGDTDLNTKYGTTTSFGIPDIQGQPAKVMKFPKTAAQAGGYLVSHGANPNAGGFQVNQYTIIMDVLFPTLSSGKRRALIDTDLAQNAEVFINEADALGTDGGSFEGLIRSNTWHRIALAVDLAATPPKVDKFIDGVKAGSQTVGGLDSRFSIGSYFYLFEDDNDEVETGYINSLQFNDVKLSDGLITALGGATANGILTGPPPNPYIDSVSPDPQTARFPGRSTVGPEPEIKIVIEDGVTKAQTNTIQLKYDDRVVVPLIRKTNNTTTITFSPGLQPSLSVHTVSLTYRDSGTPAATLGTQFQFAVGPYFSLPNAGSPLGSASTRGFTVRTVQAPGTEILANNLSRALQQLNGTLVSGSGTLIPNEAVPGPYNVDLIDFEASGTPVGNFQSDAPFPGIPGAGGETTNFALEILTYLELGAGPHTFGLNVGVDRTDVGDDDGYVLFSGPNARSFFATEAGEFVRTVGGFNERQNNNEFTFIVPATGVYPFRLVYWQTGHGANLEWFSVDQQTGNKILINDSADARAVKAYRVSTAAVANTPAIVEVSPRPGIAGVLPTAPIQALIDDGQTAVATNSIRLSLNGTAVTPVVTKSGARTTVSYQPSANRSEVTNKVVLIYGAGALSFTNEWTFNISVTQKIKVTGQWDFNNGLAATLGSPLEYLDGPAGQTASKTKFGTTSAGDFAAVPSIDGQPAQVMAVPGDLSRDIGYIMRHGIAPNGGGTRVNQYTLIMDILVATAGPGAASLIQINSLNNTDDGDLFWQGNNFGQGTGGYNGTGAFTAGAWHRVVAAVDLAANPPRVTKFVDGIKQDDWNQQSLDQDRRALKEFAILFGDGDQDERRVMYLNSIQILDGKLSDADVIALGGPKASGIPLPTGSVTGKWDFDRGNLEASIGQDLEFLGGTAGASATKTTFGTTGQGALASVPGINGRAAKVMAVPGDLSRDIGYIMRHGINPNGGGTRVNQYTLIMDVLVEAAGPGAASLLQVNSLNNTDDGDLFWQGNRFGQGTGGYNGITDFTAGAWHRIAYAVDLAAKPPIITKFLDGVKQDDWVQQSLDQDRRALREYAILFGDGDQDERRRMYVNSVQIRSVKLSDPEMAALGGPNADGIPTDIPATSVTGQWDFFAAGQLKGSVGAALEFLDGTSGQTATKTKFGVTGAGDLAAIPGIGDVPTSVIAVPGDLSRDIGYIMRHGITPNGGGTRVNQYTLIMDIMVAPTGPGAASLIQINSLNNTDDGDLFWQGNNFGQGTGGYNGTGAFTAGAWHRVSAAVDLAANPPRVTKFVDGIKQDDWNQQSLDQDRRALKEFAILFGDGDQDERRVMYVSSIQIRKAKLSDADLINLGGPSASKIPVLIAAPVPVEAKIEISRSGNALTLSWPAGVSGYVLESSPNLRAGSWVAVAGVANNSVTIQLTGAAQFYRLRK